MTSALLSFGCALVAFSPTVFPLFLLAFHKAHLMILITTSAFAYLFSTLLSSLCYIVIPPSWQAARSHPLALLLPSVVCQTWMRCGFVWLYHGVENVIQRSVRVHERQERRRRRAIEDHRRREQQAQGRRRQSDASRNTTSASDAAYTNTSTLTNTTNTPSSNNNNNPGGQGEASMSESMQLHLELNDWSSALASGTGYALMHALLLYGTLLASESGGMGTLYQPSCLLMPSLATSALQANLFSVLDIINMLWVFYGMRRCQAAGEIYKRQFALDQEVVNRGRGYHAGRGRLWGRARESLQLVLARVMGSGGGRVLRHEEEDASPTTPYTAEEEEEHGVGRTRIHAGSTGTSTSTGTSAGRGTTSPQRRLLGSSPPRTSAYSSPHASSYYSNTTSTTTPYQYNLYENTPMSGTMAILISFLSHLAAGFLTSLNVLQNGCVLSLPLLGVVVVVSGMAFYFLIAPEYLLVMVSNGSGSGSGRSGGVSGGVSGSSGSVRGNYGSEEGPRSSLVSRRSSAHEE